MLHQFMRVAPILALSVVAASGMALILSGCGAFPGAGWEPDGGAVLPLDPGPSASSTVTPVASPALNGEGPAHIETATFALG